ncbi:hypothetical protein DOY81_007725 [Sarcophaga bullata]|nr:hypothetical protein DOY81_007725 [Sarcophaga bullata]
MYTSIQELLISQSDSHKRSESLMGNEPTAAVLEVWHTTN